MKLKPLDPHNPIPLKNQAEAVLRELIAQEDYQNGQQLPNEITLARQLGVSRGTIRAAVSSMVFEGLLERRAGVGTKVKKTTTESGVGAWRSLTLEMRLKGVEVQTFSMSFLSQRITKDVAKALGVPDGSSLFRLDRLRGWHDRPILHSRSWFHPRLKLAPDLAFDKPLYEVLENATGHIADRAVEEFLAVPAENSLATLLNVKQGAPLLLRRHVVFDRTGHPMEFAEVHYVSKFFSLTLDLRRDL